MFLGSEPAIDKVFLGSESSRAKVFLGSEPARAKVFLVTTKQNQHVGRGVSSNTQAKPIER